MGEVREGTDGGSIAIVGSGNYAFSDVEYTTNIAMSRCGAPRSLSLAVLILPRNAWRHAGHVVIGRVR